MGVWIETLFTQDDSILIYVTPYVGVWIETSISRAASANCKVTPYVGVWIETSRLRLVLSHPNVTPYVGVWIETLNYLYYNYLPLSLLMWECGLKHALFKKCFWSYRSLLMWECGLKLDNLPTPENIKSVTPYVGVWIETRFSGEPCKSRLCHSLCGSVD